MIYKDFKDKKISALGMGTMRLPIIDGDNGKIDVAKAEEMIAYAMENGINYYDTAWGYHEGTSEIVVGEILKKYPRDSFYLASKFPGYDLDNMDKVEEIFEAQLKKCQVEYFDFYLIHNLCEMNLEQYLDPKYGIYEYLMKQKENGRIKHLGFSNHGGLDCLSRFLEAYGEVMEFGQLQMNWLDYNFQNARTQMKMLSDRGIPTWVMEPMRGGMLAKLDDEYEQQLRTLRPDESTADWAIRFLQTIPVTVTLTGASSLEQMKQNIEAFEEAKPLSDEEYSTLMNIAKDMTGRIALPCTSCRYCTSKCPIGLDIPMLIGLYNEHSFTGGGFIAPMALAAVDRDKRPKACIGCRACEQVCPQGIKISEAMADFTAMLKKK